MSRIQTTMRIPDPYLKGALNTGLNLDRYLNTGPLGDQRTFGHLNTGLVWYSDPHCTTHTNIVRSIFMS